MIGKEERITISRLVAKAIAYKNCGKDKLAEEYACQLIEELECTDILNPKLTGRTGHVNQEDAMKTTRKRIFGTALISPGNYPAEVELVPNQTGCGLYWARVRVIKWTYQEPDYSITNIFQVFKIWKAHFHLKTK